MEGVGWCEVGAAAIKAQTCAYCWRNLANKGALVLGREVTVLTEAAFVAGETRSVRGELSTILWVALCCRAPAR